MAIANQITAADFYSTDPISTVDRNCSGVSQFPNVAPIFYTLDPPDADVEIAENTVSERKARLRTVPSMNSSIAWTYPRWATAELRLLVRVIWPDPSQAAATRSWLAA